MTSGGRRQSRIRHRRSVSIFALAVVALVAGACNRDGGSANGPTSAPAVGSSLPGGSTVAPGTTVAPWTDAPPACLLLARSEVEYVLGFPVDPDPEPVRIDTPDPAQGGTCTWRNPDTGYRGGYVAVTLYRPGTDLSANRTQWTEVVDLPGIGASAYVGHYKEGLGEGPNAVSVDMGDGSFVLNVYAFQRVPQDQVAALADRVARRWAQDRAGGIPLDPRTTAANPEQSEDLGELPTPPTSAGPTAPTAPSTTPTAGVAPG